MTLMGQIDALRYEASVAVEEHQAAAACEAELYARMRDTSLLDIAMVAERWRYAVAQTRIAKGHLSVARAAVETKLQQYWREQEGA